MTRYRSTGYTDEFRARHAAEVAQKEVERQELGRQNEELRQQRLAAIAAERAAKIKEHEAAIDAALEPRKQVERHRWLVEHPTQTERDFEAKAWPHLKQVLLSEEKEQQLRSATDRLRQSGQYGRL